MGPACWPDGNTIVGSGLCEAEDPIDHDFKQEIHQEINLYKSFYWPQLSDPDLNIKRQAVADLKANIWNDICPIKNVGYNDTLFGLSWTWEYNHGFNYFRTRGPNQDIFQLGDRDMDKLQEFYARTGERSFNIEKTFWDEHQVSVQFAKWVVFFGLIGLLLWALLELCGWLLRTFGSKPEERDEFLN